MPEVNLPILPITIGDYTVTMQSIDIKHSITNTFHSFNIKSNKGYAYTICISDYPTGNCQLSAISYINNLLTLTKNIKEESVAILKACYKLINIHFKYIPNLAIVDVKIPFNDGVTKCFDVVHELPYKSTNGSNMHLFIIKVQGMEK